MAVQVVDRHQRQSPRPGKRLGSGDADEQRSDQPRPRGDGDRFDLVGQHLLDHRRDQLEMPARGDLGHHPAEARVQLILGRDDPLATISPLLSNERGGRFNRSSFSMPRITDVRRAT